MTLEVTFTTLEDQPSLRDAHITIEEQVHTVRRVDIVEECLLVHRLPAPVAA